MGNKYSVVREEEEEAEYAQLVRAVQVAQRRARREVDLEAGIRVDDPLHDAPTVLACRSPTALARRSPSPDIAAPFSGADAHMVASFFRSSLPRPNFASEEPTVTHEEVDHPQSPISISSCRRGRSTSWAGAKYCRRATGHGDEGVYEHGRSRAPSFTSRSVGGSSPTSSTRASVTAEQRAIVIPLSHESDDDLAALGGICRMVKSPRCSPSPAPSHSMSPTSSPNVQHEDELERTCMAPLRPSSPTSAGHRDSPTHGPRSTRSWSYSLDADYISFHSASPTSIASGAAPSLQDTPGTEQEGEHASDATKEGILSPALAHQLPDSPVVPVFPPIPSVAQAITVTSRPILLPSSESSVNPDLGLDFCLSDGKPSGSGEHAPHRGNQSDRIREEFDFISPDLDHDQASARAISPGLKVNPVPCTLPVVITKGSASLCERRIQTPELMSRRVSRSSSPSPLVIRIRPRSRSPPSPYGTDARIAALLQNIQSQEQQLTRVADFLERALFRPAPVEARPLRESRASSIERRDKSVSDSEGPESDAESIPEKKVHMDVKPYPNLPYAAGLRTAKRCSKDGWNPVWKVFPLKMFRGADWAYLKVQPVWDDEQLLRELSKSYDRLRTVWRKWFSLRSVGSIVMVLADHTFIYPQRVGTAGLSPSKNMRLRYFLHHPEAMRGRHEFLQVFTANPDLGVEFVERWQVLRIAIVVLIPVIFSVVLGVMYSGITGDASTAFTIAGYMTSAYSVCLVLVGVLNLVET